MQGDANKGLDWDVLAGKCAKYVSVFAGVMLGVLTLPMFSEQSPARLLIALGLAIAAALALASARSLRKKGDATEGAARLIVGVLFGAAALWFSNLVPAPSQLRAPSVAGEVNEVIRTVGNTAPREGLDRHLSWTVYPPGGAATRLQAPLEDALAIESARRLPRHGSRTVSAGVRVTARAGSLAGGQVTATLRVALAATGAPQCEFAVTTPRPMPLDAAAEWLAEQAVDHAQTYVEGSDAC